MKKRVLFIDKFDTETKELVTLYNHTSNAACISASLSEDQKYLVFSVLGKVPKKTETNGSPRPQSECSMYLVYLLRNEPTFLSKTIEIQWAQWIHEGSRRKSNYLLLFRCNKQIKLSQLSEGHGNPQVSSPSFSLSLFFFLCV